MRVTLPRSIPLRWRFEEAEGREDGWGRLERLTPLGCRLSTRFRLEPGDRVYASFEAAGEAFEDVLCRVERSVRDEDGYFLVDLRVRDEVEARRLGAALRGFVTRAR